MGTLERELARHVGPIAGRLVKGAMRRAGSFEGLCALLASNLDAGDRQRFTERMQAGLRASTLHGTSQRDTFQPGTASLPAAGLEQARMDLAHHVGPIARVLVKRAAAGCATIGELRERLAAYLDSAAAREAFLRRP